MRPLTSIFNISFIFSLDGGNGYNSTQKKTLRALDSQYTRIKILLTDRQVNAQIPTPEAYYRLLCHPQELNCELTPCKQLPWKLLKSSGGFCGILRAVEGVTKKDKYALS